MYLIKIYFFLCMYEVVVEITKETWEKYGIKTVKHYNKKEDIIELWNKMSDIKIQLEYWNICDIALKRIRKYCGKTLQKKKNKNIKHFLKVKQVFLLLKNLHVI